MQIKDTLVNRLNRRLDEVEEFEREPVPESRLKGWKGFVGMYIGENTAGTEFVIGTMFVAHGVSASALISGLVVGNILAVCSWAFLTAPVAVKTRLTLYWQLRKICGPNLASLYNVVNAIMYCFLAGAMIAVSATAVGLPFHVAMPTLNDWLPTNVGWVVAVLAVGIVITVVAMFGYDKVSQFANACSPWMILVFFAAGLAVLPQLGVNLHNISDFWTVANHKIWTGNPAAGQVKYGFWDVMFFSWFTNMAMNIDMSDMSILRYAEEWYHGFSPAPSVFLGHFMAWISSGILTAAAFGAIAPGIIAYHSAGAAGLIAVVIAGWTTANPTLYRAGLAFQAATPNWKRWKVTLVTGLITSIAALFPALVMQLLNFVALYGLLLMPMGVVILLDVFLFPKLGLKSNLAEVVHLKFNMAAGLTWFITLTFCLLLYLYGGIQIFFLGLPGWFFAAILYVGLSFLFQRKYNSEAYQAVSKSVA
ncbi:MAG TPA: hypothetical protein VKA34_00700 [Balneolales bacterium]|nr:hypothetical protein [Balneolales bacterium]